MKVEGRLFLLAAIFFAAISAIYWYVSSDPIGTTALAMSGGLGLLVAFYTLYTSKRVYPRPEDRGSAEIDEADPEFGFYSPHSWWPLVVGFSAFLIVLGLIFAVWVIVLAVSVLLIGLVGWLFEYYRGDFAV